MVRNNPVEYCDLNGTAKLSRKDIATWYLWQKEALSQLDQLHYALDVSGSRTGVAKASLANLGFLTLRGTAKLAASAAGGAVGTLLVPGPGTFVGGALASLGADEIVDKIQDKAGVSSPHFSTQEAVRALENVDVNIARKKWSDATKGGGIKMGLAARAADSVQNLIFGRAAPVNPVDIGTLLTDSYASAGKMKASKEKKYTSLLDLIDKTQEAIQDDVTEFFHEMEKATGIQDSRVEIPGIVSEYTFGKVSLPLLKVGSANHHVKTKHEASANKMGKMGRDIHASVDSARAKLRNIGQRGAANRP
jgi:hypothetical protein